ncbi:MAG: hypothetical protein HY815_16440 [Candidatus Riflebacteria bacterium]|nr:hypothetical protein [Candidatus Riflebacteria bacterium]
MEIPSVLPRCASKALQRIVVVAFLGTAILPVAAPGKTYNQWRLTGITHKVYSGTLQHFTAHARGGTLEVARGPAPDCRSAPLRFRFTWTFNRDVTSLAGWTKDEAVTVRLSVERFGGSQCLLGNGYMLVSSTDFLVRNSGGEARFYDDPRHNFHHPGPRVFTINDHFSDTQTLHFFIGAHLTNSTDVDYHYVRVKAPAPPQPRPPVDSVGGRIGDKWRSLGGARGVLGRSISGEMAATPSPFRTQGRYRIFERGLIIWHASGRYLGRAFAVIGAILKLYRSMGATGSWLGLPISDEYDWYGGKRADFEGGYIHWTRARGARAFWHRLR